MSGASLVLPDPVAGDGSANLYVMNQQLDALSQREQQLTTINGLYDQIAKLDPLNPTQTAERKKYIGELQQVRIEQAQLTKQRSDLARSDAGTSRHIANETDWLAYSVAPDFCQVGTVTVPFDSFAVIDNEQLASPDVKAHGVPVYRVGDLSQGVLADAGQHVVSQTSLGSGYVKMLEDESAPHVKVNGQRAARDGTACLINCTAMGVGGTEGRLQTATKSVIPTQPEKPPPNAALQALLDAQADQRPWYSKAGDAVSAAWDGTQRVAGAMLDHPGDAGIGVLKGIGNLPTDLWNLVVMAGKSQAGVPMMTAALDAEALARAGVGDIAQANRLAEAAHRLETMGSVGDLFELKNDAQKGGAVASILAPVGTLAKGAGTLGKAARGAKEVEAVADVANGTDATANAAKAAGVTEEAVKTQKAAEAQRAAKGGVHVKAAFGEKVANDAMKERGFQPLGKTEEGYKAGKKGIDGVYKNPNPPPDYIITEAKYNTSPLRKSLADDTNQMDDVWVGKRLEGAVGKEQARLIEQAMQEGKVEKWLLRVDPDGAVRAFKLDDAAKIVGPVTVP